VLAAVLAVVAAILRDGRSRCRAGKKNGKNDLTHDSNFLWFPVTGSALRQMSGG